MGPSIWPSFIEIGEMACITTAWSSHGHALNLWKWNSNSRELLKAIENCDTSQDQVKPIEKASNEDDESYAKSSTTPGNSEVKNETVVKVLGLNWDTVSDEFSWILKNCTKMAEPFQRQNVQF